MYSEAKRKAAEEEKKAAMAALSMNTNFKSQGKFENKNRFRLYSGTNSPTLKGNRGKSSRVDRERKKKALAERRKPLNVDHLGQEKLLEKITEMHAYLCKIEKERWVFGQMHFLQSSAGIRPLVGSQ